jgi:hypothetical protein
MPVRTRSVAFCGSFLALAAGIALLVEPGDTGDLPFFVHTSKKLFSADWANVFANPDVQVGPLQLLVFRLGEVAGILPLLVQIGVAALLWIVVGRLLTRHGPSAQLLVGLAAVALGLTYGAYQDGHPAQVLIPLLWVLAGLEAKDDRAMQAGLLVGLSAGFELWGLVGAVVFVVAPRARAALAGLATEALVVAGLFLPFVIAGEFRMFQYRWQVNGETLLSLLVEPGTRFTWAMRVLQGTLAIAVGVGLAWPFRRTLHAVWLAPLGAVAVRLALDPVRYPWYWLAVETLALLGLAELLTSPTVESWRLRVQRSTRTWKSPRNLSGERSRES